MTHFEWPINQTIFKFHPDDSTRVKIRNGTDEDYINASHVNMEIPGTGIVNRYIATQGPLSNTTQDFWEMVWEQKSTLIVMVTPLIENDFIKCHKYWPDLNETLKLHDDMKLTSIKQTDNNIMVERKFNLVKGGKKRTITHLLYKQWPGENFFRVDWKIEINFLLSKPHSRHHTTPDHGVPDDSTHFHQLINTVRRYRASMNNEPIIVHCSGKCVEHTRSSDSTRSLLLIFDIFVFSWNWSHGRADSDGDRSLPNRTKSTSLSTWSAKDNARSTCSSHTNAESIHLCTTSNLWYLSERESDQILERMFSARWSLNEINSEISSELRSSFDGWT